MGFKDAVAPDTHFYAMIGGLLILIYIVAISTAVWRGLVGVDRQLIPFIAGFFVFILIYFIAVLTLRLEPDGH